MDFFASLAFHVGQHLERTSLPLLFFLVAKLNYEKD